MGICQICNGIHKLPISRLKEEAEKFKFTIYNTICNCCVTKLDPIFKKSIIFKKEVGMTLQNTGRKIVMVNAATNTDDMDNFGRYPNLEQSNILENAPVHEEKPIVESTSSNEQVIEYRSCIKENPQKNEIQVAGKYCEYCKKKFTHTGDLNKHRRKHTGERPYDCSLCHIKFTHVSNLIRHQRLHSGENPYSCPQKCGKTFSRKDKLSTHISKEHRNA
ncbi:zinc finger protein 271-like [Belonocnema kinseyi]|uniref:zinc finger protein 271-like n=1 Tax=Belonocnema kinseyi TaxID=2817044 RepID=UPI00143D60D2|nr:zinc finger protein 271-like [Belonocnema kinseyi]